MSVGSECASKPAPTARRGQSLFSLFQSPLVSQILVQPAFKYINTLRCDNIFCEIIPSCANTVSEAIFASVNIYSFLIQFKRMPSSSAQISCKKVLLSKALHSIHYFINLQHVCPLSSHLQCGQIHTLQPLFIILPLTFCNHSCCSFLYSF